MCVLKKGRYQSRPKLVSLHNMWRYSVAVFAHASAAAAQAAGGAPYFTCATQIDFIAGANPFIDGICCAQSAETCKTNFYPSTCASPACARAAR